MSDDQSWETNHNQGLLTFYETLQGLQYPLLSKYKKKKRKYPHNNAQSLSIVKQYNIKKKSIKPLNTQQILNEATQKFLSFKRKMAILKNSQEMLMRKHSNSDKTFEVVAAVPQKNYFESLNTFNQQQSFKSRYPNKKKSTIKPIQINFSSNSPSFKKKQRFSQTKPKTKFHRQQFSSLSPQNKIHKLLDSFYKNVGLKTSVNSKLPQMGIHCKFRKKTYNNLSKLKQKQDSQQYFTYRMPTETMQPDIYMASVSGKNIKMLTYQDDEEQNSKFKLQRTFVKHEKLQNLKTP